MHAHGQEGDRVKTWLGVVEDLRPLIERHRTDIDRDRRLPAPLFRAVAETGLLRLWLPASLGGPQLSPLDFMAVVEAAAGLDGSLGWVIGNGAGMSRAGGYLSGDVAGEWFADPQAFIVSSTGGVGRAERVEGGYRVTGRWPFGSGAHHATVFMGLCAEPDGGSALAPPAVPFCCYMPALAVTVHDTWFVSGLRGSGSCEFEVRDLFVPLAHVHAFQPPPTQDGALYRMPQPSIFSWTVSVVPLGIASAAWRHAVEVAIAKGRQGQPQLLRDRETVQSEVGQAQAQLRAARAFLVESMDDLFAGVTSGVEDLVPERAAFRLACSHAADTAVHVVDRLARMVGAVAILESQPLERCVRDVHAAAKHIAMNPNNYTIAGRLALGLEPPSARF